MIQPTIKPTKAILLHRFRLISILTAIWAFGFGAINFYWGLGGTIGVQTLGERMAELALSRDPELLFVNWLSVIGKITIGLMILALLRWHKKRFGKFLHIATWCIGILLLVYGFGNAVQHILMAVGQIPIALSLGSVSAVLSHLLIWDPVWISGGLLFLLTAWQCLKLNRTNA